MSSVQVMFRILEWNWNVSTTAWSGTDYWSATYYNSNNTNLLCYVVIWMYVLCLSYHVMSCAQLQLILIMCSFLWIIWVVVIIIIIMFIICLAAWLDLLLIIIIKIVCATCCMQVAHQEIDIKNVESNVCGSFFLNFGLVCCCAIFCFLQSSSLYSLFIIFLGKKVICSCTVCFFFLLFLFGLIRQCVDMLHFFLFMWQRNVSPGFTDAERNNFSELLKEGFVDTFR